MVYLAIAALGLSAGTFLHWSGLALIAGLLGIAVGAAGAVYEASIEDVMTRGAAMIFVLDFAYLTAAVFTWKTVGQGLSRKL